MYLLFSDVQKLIVDTLQEEVVPQTLSTKQMDDIADILITKLRDGGVDIVEDDEDEEGDDEENDAYLQLTHFPSDD
jgi:hypothetical protein